MSLIIVTLMKLKLDVSYQALEVFVGIDSVTLCRQVNRISKVLGEMPLFGEVVSQYLIVDSTSTRVRSREQADYSGHKHYKTRKCQMIVGENRKIVAVSDGYAGSIHDKRIWDAEFSSVKNVLYKPVLADKGYAGGTGENQLLFRPAKRNESEYKSDETSAKTFNARLSRHRVKVEHVFGHLKQFKILANLFPLHKNRYGLCFRLVALVHNLNLEAA